MDIAIALGVIFGLTLIFLVIYLGVRALQGPRDPSAGSYEHADDPGHADEADWSNTAGTADPHRE
jgi:hypothetical protein